MKLKNLDAVVLRVDLPDHDLKAGDLGTVVEVHGDDAVEVEFLPGSGDTQAVVTLPISDLRPATHDDVIAVRPSGKR